MINPILAILIMLFVSSCATIISGENQNISLQSSEPDKKIEVLVRNGVSQVETEIPAVIRIKKDQQPLIITVKENGCYEQTNTYSQPEYDIIMILGGIPGTVTDMSTGAAWKYQSNVYVNVEKKDKKSCR